MDNNEFRRFLKEKIVSGTEKAVSNGIFYSINKEWLNNQKNRTFDHVQKVAERYNLEVILIGYKESEPNNITILDNNVKSFIDFDLNEFSDDFTIYDRETIETKTVEFLKEILNSEESDKEKLCLIESKTDELKELVSLSERIKPFELITLWNDGFYKVVEKESVKLSFDGYIFEIGFFAENEYE